MHVVEADLGLRKVQLVGLTSELPGHEAQASTGSDRKASAASPAIITASDATDST